MSTNTNVINAAPYLRTSRNFPFEAQPLAVELNRSYVDIATKVNDRVIGLFPTFKPAITGEQWFLSGTSQAAQTLRQIYQFDSAGAIPHGINVATIGGFTAIYGTFFDGSVWYPLPYVDVVSATNQVNITVDATNINITAGAGSPPSIESGLVILQWLSQV